MKALIKTSARLATQWLALLVLLSAQGAYAATEITFFHNDLLGSPVAATDEAGAIKWREGYHPYGARTDVESAAEHNDVWFTGAPEDAESGLVYMNARYYDGEAGRFMAIDPVGYRGNSIHSFGRYTYVNNNPYRYTDPSGEIPVDTIADGIVVLVTAGEVFGASGAFFWGVATNNQALQNIAVQGLEDLQTDMVLATAAFVTPYASAKVYKTVDASQMAMQATNVAKKATKHPREWFNAAVLAAEITIAAMNYGYTGDSGYQDFDHQVDEVHSTEIKKRKKLEPVDPPKVTRPRDPNWHHKYGFKKKKGWRKAFSRVYRN